MCVTDVVVSVSGWRLYVTDGVQRSCSEDFIRRLIFITQSVYDEHKHFIFLSLLHQTSTSHLSLFFSGQVKSGTLCFCAPLSVGELLGLAHPLYCWFRFAYLFKPYMLIRLLLITCYVTFSCLTYSRCFLRSVPLSNYRSVWVQPKHTHTHTLPIVMENLAVCFPWS